VNSSDERDHAEETSNQRLCEEERDDEVEPIQPILGLSPYLLVVLTEVSEERALQDERWGEQNHPDGTGDYPEIIDADIAKMACQDAAAGGYLTWTHILREEVAEAFAETAPESLRAELVQVAAVAVQWIQAIDRRTRRRDQRV